MVTEKSIYKVLTQGKIKMTLQIYICKVLKNINSMVESNNGQKTEIFCYPKQKSAFPASCLIKRVTKSATKFCYQALFFCYQMQYVGLNTKYFKSKTQFK